VRIAIAAQRYGADINGGAELHARYIAERLSRHAEVEVLTTCAQDYVTWADAFPPGVDSVNGVTVRRFPVTHPRDARTFARHSAAVFERRHSVQEELAWLKSEGPTCPALVRHVAASADAFDWFVFFSYRYFHAFHGARAVAAKAVLVPTAERDAAIGLGIFPPLFRGVRAMMFNSFEERAMIRHVASDQNLPGVVVGVGSDVPEHPQPHRFRQRFGIDGPFAIYVGRIDENKGCGELFVYFQRFARQMAGSLQLVLIGQSLVPVPSHPRVRHLGFLSDQDKFDAIAAADVLVMPSYYESLSMVALEAWALGRPVLANAKCDVLKGQALRSNAALYYDNYGEFAEALFSIASSAPLREALGRNGRNYFGTHYAWPVIERKYLETFDRLARQPTTQHPTMAPLPGFFERRARNLPPAEEVLAEVPGGAVRR
jgi:glycosyltransferase involved in cell wall biosynthesis